jgi:transcription elongation factor Elf1
MITYRQLTSTTETFCPSCGQVATHVREENGQKRMICQNCALRETEAYAKSLEQ